MAIITNEEIEKFNEENRKDIFNEHMRDLREEKGKKEKRDLTIKIASEEMGIHYNTLSNYEYDRYPKVEELIKIKKYYNVSIDYLLAETTSKNPKADYGLLQKETSLTDEAIESLKNLTNIKNRATYSKENHMLLLKAINILLENELEYHFFENIASYLWHDFGDDTIDIEEKNTGNTYPFPTSMMQEVTMLRLGDLLQKLKSDIKNNK